MRLDRCTMMFGSQETIHATAYSYLNETLGLEDFEEVLAYELTMRREVRTPNIYKHRMET